MAQIAVKVDSDLVARCDRHSQVFERHTKMRVTRAAVVACALRLGLAQLEKQYPAKPSPTSE